MSGGTELFYEAAGGAEYDDVTQRARDPQRFWLTVDDGFATTMAK